LVQESTAASATAGVDTQVLYLTYYDSGLSWRSALLRSINLPNIAAFISYIFCTSAALVHFVIHSSAMERSLLIESLAHLDFLALTPKTTSLQKDPDEHICDGLTELAAHLNGVYTVSEIRECLW
jgi:hypothetical protein